MSIYRYHGLVRKPTGFWNDVALTISAVDLRPVQRISYKYDPFCKSANQVRDVSFYLSHPKVRETNFKCVFKTTIVSDQSEPEVVCKLENGKELKFKADNLTALEILEELNSITHPLLPPPEEPVTIVSTKSQKKQKK